jgi:hypothetical protein
LVAFDNFVFSVGSQVCLGGGRGGGGGGEVGHCVGPDRCRARDDIWREGGSMAEPARAPPGRKHTARGAPRRRSAFSGPKKSLRRRRGLSVRLQIRQNDRP